jgi:nitrate/nitrite transporter NarK
VRGGDPSDYLRRCLAPRTSQRVGIAKSGYIIAVSIWTAARLADAFVGSLTGIKIAQTAWGFGLSGNFPAALKAVVDWFSPKECAFANGIFNAGTNVGEILPPVIVPVVMLIFGWHWAFALCLLSVAYATLNMHGSVPGIGGTAGVIEGIYFLAAVVTHWLTPRLAMVNLS